MKFVPIVFVGPLVALAACQDPAPSTQPTSPPEAEQPAARQQPAAYRIDTVAVLTNRRLDQLLTEADQTSLTSYQLAKALPQVIAAFLERAQQEPVPIADVGQAYESTDLIMGDLPRRQLTYLGIGENLVLLAYNLGGYGVSERVLLFQLKNGEIADFWTGYVRGQRHTKAEIIRYLREHKDEKHGVNTNIICF